MKRWPLVASFILFVLLCATAAYWAMQLFKPSVRPVAAPQQSDQPVVQLDAASGLFGGRRTVAVASNYQLRGVVVSGNPADSVAILATDGKPAQAIRANREVVPGVTVKEVHRGYVVLAENGVSKRVDLPESVSQQAQAAQNPASRSPVQARSTPAERPVIVNPPPQPAAPANSAGAGNPPPGMVPQPGLGPQPGLTPQQPVQPGQPVPVNEGTPGNPAQPPQ